MKVCVRKNLFRPSVSDGFIIVAVLWILIALATLASIYSIYVRNSALAVSVMDEELQAEALVSAGLELTTCQLAVPKDTQRGTDSQRPPDAQRATDPQRPTHGQFGFRLGRANVVVSFTSEAARIDLNAAPKELLIVFFMALGASNEDAARYADRIIGWRGADKPTKQTDQTASNQKQADQASTDLPNFLTEVPPNPAAAGTAADEAALYRSAELPYLPRGASFAHMNELWLVYGLPPELARRALPFVTIYSGLPDINVFDAPSAADRGPAPNDTIANGRLS